MCLEVAVLLMFILCLDEFDALLRELAGEADRLARGHAGAYGENGHAGEERVRIASVREAARVIALYLLRWCGAAE